MRHLRLSHIVSSGLLTFPLAVAVILLPLISLVGCSREDSPSAKVGKKGAITFTATSGNSSAATKSSADAFSAGASLSAGVSTPSSIGGSSVDAERTYQIYYDFEKGENVEAPQCSSYDSDGNLVQSSDTQFSGEVFTVSSTNIERIEWEDGDRILIAGVGDDLNPYGATTLYHGIKSEYIVKDVTTGSGSKAHRSIARLVPSDGSGLQWKEGDNNIFVAIYPSPTVFGLSLDDVTVVKGLTSIMTTDNLLMEYPNSFNHWPSTQYCYYAGERAYKGISTPSGRDEIWYEPDMRYAYMSASASVGKDDVPKDALSLEFKSHFNSLEVKLVKPDALSSSTVKIRSAIFYNGVNKTFAGGYIGAKRYHPLAENRYFHTDHIDGGTVLKFRESKTSTTDFYPELSDKPLSFTFILPHQSGLMELCLELEIDDVLVTRTLKLQTVDSYGTTTPISFPGVYGKLTITNMKTPAVDVTPLTIEPIEAGTTTITINNPYRLTYKYTINGTEYPPTDAHPIEIPASQGDKVALYQDGAVALGAVTSYVSDPPAYSDLGLINFSNQCYVYGNVMSLASEKAYPNLKSTVINQFTGLFRKNINLRSHPTKKLELPAKTLDIRCYSEMFSGCTGLETAPALPATTLAWNCYEGMFDGCTNLETAPSALPAETMPANCCYYMFRNCTSLKDAPALPATTLAGACYEYMFEGCTSLINAPALPATTLAWNCYTAMFRGCTSLKDAPALSAETLAKECCESMFEGCTSLETAPALLAETMADNCYYWMFRGCTSLETAPALLAKTLAKECCVGMFEGCTSLTDAPALPAETMAEGCYRSMFKGCTSLGTAPALPAETMAAGCYQTMFEGCTSLGTAPALPAKTLAKNCYAGMFRNCTSLGTAPPTLPAETMASNCYYNMFSFCTSLGTAPALPAETLAAGCYQNMFFGCTSLGTAPALPATGLAPLCYCAMFKLCESLVTGPDLPATNSVEDCYREMFWGCKSLISLKCNLLETSATNCVQYWLRDVGTPALGVRPTFYKNESYTTWPRGESGIPATWTIINITP